MKQFFKNIIFSIFNLLGRGTSDKASILMYHSVGDNNAFATVTKDNFRKQLQFLKDKKIKVIKLSELAKRLRSGKKIDNCVCITFDDGYEDNYKTVFPIIRQYNYPITVFLATGFIGKYFTNSQGVKISILKEEQIKEMSDIGLVDFAPHTHNHCLLDSVPYEEAVGEIERSKKEIKKITGNSVDIFAYPKGKFNKKIIKYLKDDDWLCAVGIQEGLAGRRSDIFNLERNSIDSSTSFMQFKGKVSLTINIYNKIKKCLK